MMSVIPSTRELERPRKGCVPFEQSSGRINQRLAVRYELRARVEFCWVDDKGISRHGVGHTRDVSTRGTYILGAAPPKGTSVAMNMEIQFSPTISSILRVETEGRVVRVDRPGNDGLCAGFSVQNDRVASFRG